jgi:hypothetical protein
MGHNAELAATAGALDDPADDPFDPSRPWISAATPTPLLR